MERGLDYRSKSLDDIYIRAKNILNSASAELWDGRIAEPEQRALLLKSAFPIEKDSACEKKFLNILESLGDFYNLEIIESGIDNSGLQYLIFPYQEFTALSQAISNATSVNEKLKIFIQCLQAVSDFHIKGFSLGDISIDSFRILENQDIATFSFLATAESIAKLNTTVGSLKVYQKYMAPELKMGSPVSKVSDVYALGILGYQILCGEKSIHEATASTGSFIKTQQAPSSLDPNIPSWFTQVLANALSMDPIKRISDSQALLAHMEGAVRTGNIDLPNISWSSNELIVQAKAKEERSEKKVGSDLIYNPKSEANEKLNHESSKKKSKKKSDKEKNKIPTKLIIRGIWIITGLGLLGLAISLLVSFRVVSVGKKELPPLFTKEELYLNESKLMSTLETFLANNEMPEVKLKAFSDLLRKNVRFDQTMFLYLTQAFRILPDGYNQQLTETILYWIEKFSYIKTKEDIKTVLDQGTFANSPYNYPEMANLILGVIDNGADDASRISNIRKLFVKAEGFSIRLAALLIEDSSSSIFMPVLREFLSARGFIDLPKDASKRALYMLVDETRSILGSDLNKLLEESSIEDLKIIATALLSNSLRVNKEFFTAALNCYLKAVDLGKFAQVFIEMGQIEARYGSPQGTILYKLALGSANAKDLSIFLEWNNPDWDRVMYAILATNKSVEVQEKAFEILSRRRPNSKVGDILLEWLKKYYWGAKSKFAYTYGVFTLKDMATTEELDRAFNNIMESSNGALFTTLVTTGDPYFIEQAAERLGPIAKVDEIFPLLANENPNIRIAGIKSLLGRNDIGTLQKILSYYRREKDPEVIKVYNEVHWVTTSNKR